MWDTALGVAATRGVGLVSRKEEIARTDALGRLERRRPMAKQRIAWIDVLKYFGIFSVYLGHMGTAAGPAYEFVFTYHVPLFFFIAGCMESISSSKSASPLSNIKKYAVTILMPFYLFAIVSIVMWALINNPKPAEVVPLLVLVAKGVVRNTFALAGVQLWFLSCLFIMHVLFELVKLLKYKWLMLVVCLVPFLVFPKPQDPPRWWYNLDGALYYIVFFCIGYIVFPVLLSFLDGTSRRNRAIIYGSGSVALVYAALVYFGRDPLKALAVVPVAANIVFLVRALIMIWFFIVLAYRFRHVTALANIGRDVLYLSGSEAMMKIVVPGIATMLGLKLEPQNTLFACIYVAFLLFITQRTLVPIERRFIDAISQRLLGGAQVIRGYL